MHGNMFDGLAKLAVIGLVATGAAAVGLLIAIPACIWWAVNHVSIAIK